MIDRSQYWKITIFDGTIFSTDYTFKIIIRVYV